MGLRIIVRGVPPFAVRRPITRSESFRKVFGWLAVTIWGCDGEKAVGIAELFPDEANVVGSTVLAVKRDPTQKHQSVVTLASVHSYEVY